MQINDNQSKITAPTIVWGLLGLGFFIFITPYIGVMIAWMKRRETQCPVERSHYTYAICTFWLGLGFCFSAVIITSVCMWLFVEQPPQYLQQPIVDLLISPLIWFFLGCMIFYTLTGIWYGYRVVKGIVLWMNQQAIAKPYGIF